MLVYLKKSYLLILILLFPGCIKYYKISDIETNQGIPIKINKDMFDLYLKSLRIYDQFQTKAIFNVLFLSKEIRKLYVDNLCVQKKIGNDEKNKLLKNEIKQLNQYITFYIISDIRDKNDDLSNKNCEWKVYLKAENKILHPIEIKKIKLDPIYRRFFGKFYIKFLNIYSVKFKYENLLNINKPFQLFFSSPYRYSSVIFNYSGSVGEYLKSIKKASTKNKN